MGPAAAPHGESTGAVIAAILSNFIVAVIKFVAATITGSSAMIAEGIHSLVDTGNGTLVLLGIKRSKKPADAVHPFGYGPELYFWSLIVAISIFGIGGGMSLYEGISHLQHPSALTNPTVNYIVLGVALLVEGASFLIAVKQFRQAKGSMRALPFIKASKDPSLFTVVFEDSAAMLGLLVAFLGVFFGHLFNEPHIDGIASIVIGLILMTVAFFLARESKGLLIGEGVETGALARMHGIVAGDKDVAMVGDIRTMYRGPHDLLVNIDVNFTDGLDTGEVDRAVGRIETALKDAYPEVNNVYIETASKEDCALKIPPDAR